MPLRPRNTRQRLARLLRYVDRYCIRRAYDIILFANAIIGVAPELGLRLKKLATTLAMASEMANEIRQDITASSPMEVTRRARDQAV